MTVFSEKSKILTDVTLLKITFPGAGQMNQGFKNN